MGDLNKGIVLVAIPLKILTAPPIYCLEPLRRDMGLVSSLPIYVGRAVTGAVLSRPCAGNYSCGVCGYHSYIMTRRQQFAALLPKLWLCILLDFLLQSFPSFGRVTGLSTCQSLLSSLWPIRSLLLRSWGSIIECYILSLNSWLPRGKESCSTLLFLSWCTALPQTQ